MPNRLLSFPLFVLLLAPLVLCHTGRSAQAEDAVDLGSGRLVLVPVNLTVRADPEVEAGIEPVWQEILAHFGGGERKVTALEPRSARALWQDILKRQKRRGKRDIYAAYSEFAKELSDQLDYDTMVFPSLVLRAARLQGTGATWDGVQRRLDGSAAEDSVYRVAASDMIVSKIGFSGEIAAASLHVAVLDANGELRYEGAGGLTLLQELGEAGPGSDEKVRVALRKDAFSNSNELREGIVAAFRQPLPASRAH